MNITAVLNLTTKVSSSGNTQNGKEIKSNSIQDFSSRIANKNNGVANLKASNQIENDTNKTISSTKLEPNKDAVSNSSNNDGIQSELKDLGISEDDLKQILQIIAQKSLKNKKVDGNGSELNLKKLVTKTKELQDILKQMQDMISQFGDVPQLKTLQQNLEKLQKQFESTPQISQSDDNSVQANQVNDVNLQNTIQTISSTNNYIDNLTVNVTDNLIESISGKGLEKGVTKVLTEFKTLLDSGNSEIKNSDTLGKKIDNFLTELNNNIKNTNTNDASSNLGQIEKEIVQILKGNNVKETKTTEKSDKKEITSADVKNVESTSNILSKDSVVDSKTDLQSVSKNTDSEKPLGMNLEQLKQKVDDTLNQIEKVVTSKDKLLVQLKPKDLGSVEVMFKKTSNGIEINVEFDQKHSKQKLEMVFDEVRKEMKDKNLEFNFVYKEKEKEEEKQRENPERKNESPKDERKLEDETGETSFQDLMEQILRGE